MEIEVLNRNAISAETSPRQMSSESALPSPALSMLPVLIPKLNTPSIVGIISAEADPHASVAMSEPTVAVFIISKVLKTKIVLVHARAFIEK